MLSQGALQERDQRVKVRVGDVMVDTELGVTQGQKPKNVVTSRTGKRQENGFPSRTHRRSTHFRGLTSRTIK